MNSIIESGKSLLSEKYQLSANKVIALSVIYMLVFDNQTFWLSLFGVIDLHDPKMWLFIFACFGVIFSVCFIFLSVFGISRLLKPLISLLLILAACTSYYMDAYGTVFDDVMVRNILETTMHEAFELIDINIISHVFFYGIIPVILLYRIDIIQTSTLKRVQTRVLAVLGVLLIVTPIVYISYKDISFVFRENREISFFINPVYPLRAVYRFAEKKYHNSNRQFLAVFEDAQLIAPANAASANKYKVLVLVVGETARAQNFSLNGYARDTNPRLSKQNIINFSNVSSCGTATAISLPCMFSDLSKENFNDNAARDRHNLLDAIHIAGMDVLWVENNPDCKGICDRIPTQQIDEFGTAEFCEDGRCYDEALLTALDNAVEHIKKDTVIVLHTQGSHGPAYYRRYPEKFRHFLPECRHSSVQDCSDEEVVNAYDNTILYTDYFLSKVIDSLQDKQTTLATAMLYVSDHGESLGENGIYLHGLPYLMAPEYQTKVPMVLWMSQGFSEPKSINTACLENKAREPLSHDNYIHNVMGLMGLSSSLYKSDLDIFNICRTNAVMRLAGVN